MYCKHCGTKLTEDSKFCPQCGIQVDNGKSKATKTSVEDIEFKNEIYELIDHIEKKRQNVFHLGVDEEITNRLRQIVTSKETAELFIKNYSDLLKRDIIEDLKGLSSNYDNIKTYLRTFIEFGIIESIFPHELKGGSQINLKTKPTTKQQYINSTSEISGGKFKFNGCLAIVGLIFLLAVVISFFLPTETDREKVYNSELDASVQQVERYLHKNLNDPESYEGIEWSKVQINESSPNYKYYVRHKYRAKNSFGGYAVEHKIFYLDKEGNIVDIKDAD